MTPEIKKIVEDMFDVGHGAATIARVLKLPYHGIFKHLKATGRHRTHKESHAVRVNNKPKKAVRV